MWLVTAQPAQQSLTTQPKPQSHYCRPQIHAALQLHSMGTEGADKDTYNEQQATPDHTTMQWGTASNVCTTHTLLAADTTCCAFDAW
jgi:hypothetical protein